MGLGRSKFTFSNWAVQDFTLNIGELSCAVITTSEIQPGKWKRVLCNSTHTAICERQKGITIKSLFLFIKLID